MNKEEKAAAVAELSDRLREAEAIFAIDYRGISVTGAAELRSRLGEADTMFKVVKNRLAKRAVADAGAEAIDELLVGPTALALVRGDAVIAAKAISSFARAHQVLEFKGGIMDGEPLDADRFAAIARLPALDVLHGQLVGIAASPITGLARGLGSMLSGLAVALGQIAEQGLVSGEDKAEESETAEPAAAEAAEEPQVEVEAEEQGRDEPEGEKGEPEEEADKPEAEAESGREETSEADDSEAKEE